jgi:hypothetical protein
MMKRMSLRDSRRKEKKRSRGLEILRNKKSKLAKQHSNKRDKKEGTK